MIKSGYIRHVRKESDPVTITPISIEKLSKQSPTMIGREDEIKLIKDSLRSSGNRFIYFSAGPGYGKTRLLKEIEKIVTDLGLGYYFSGILDFYLSDMHSNSDIEERLVTELGKGSSYFDEYLEHRKIYMRLRERGADPEALEARRKELRTLFVKNENMLAAKAYKVVICFDTVEHLQYESSAVEELAGSIDTRIKTWMLEQLPQLNNVVVVFAGRPKTSTAPEGSKEEETLDHHRKLIEDFQKAFGDKFIHKELAQLSPANVEKFILAVTGDPGFFTKEQLPVFHALTHGNPVLLNIMLDLIRVLSPEPRQIYEMFEKYSYLVGAGEENPDLKNAQNEIEQKLVESLFTQSVIKEYLTQMAVLPKGVTRPIFKEILGLSEKDAGLVFDELKKLTYVKYIESRTEFESHLVPVHTESFLMLHEELYRIFSPEFIQSQVSLEKTSAQAVIAKYYDPTIAKLSQELKDEKIPPENREQNRLRIEKLQVERLYYLLVSNPEDGYEEYKRLTEYANRFRHVGFAMRLLDEFLRFYNIAYRRKQFTNKGITHEQIVRESIQAWMERLHWWGEYKKEEEFGQKIIHNPGRFFIVPKRDAGINANIVALWVRAKTMLGHDDMKDVMDLRKAEKLLPPEDQCSPNELLGRGRLLTSVGLIFREAGFLELAVKPNDQAIACFRRLGTHPEELAMVLGNQAYVIARQGNTIEGRSLALEGLRINTDNHTLYAAGLSRTILAAIERMALEDYSEAEKWALEAKDIFEIQLSDIHGAIRTYLNLGGAWRKIAERDAERGRDKAAIIEKLNQAVRILKTGIEVAKANDRTQEIPGLEAELGKVNRSLGKLFAQEKSKFLAIPYFNESERLFQSSLNSNRWKNPAEKADINEDLAETYFCKGEIKETEQSLDAVWDLLGQDCRMEPGRKKPDCRKPNRYYLPLGKVERLKGEIALDKKEYLQSLQHFTMAYAYFEQFSKTAVEKNKMTATVSSMFLQQVPLVERNRAMSGLRAWMDDCSYLIGGVKVREFVVTLGRLIGG
jgi:hypothetical protein